MGVIESISLEFLGVVLVNSPLGGHKEYIFFSVHCLNCSKMQYNDTISFEDQ